MQRHRPLAAPSGQRPSHRILPFLLAIVATACILWEPAERAAAQPRCSDGLVGRDSPGTGALLLKTAIPGCYLPAPRVAADIHVDISGPVARAHVTQRFENPADGWVEGVYVFPLPETAAVDTLRMQVGERFVEGEIKERQTARAIYEAARTQGVKASLVEQERPNVFTNNVANIGPHETIVVQIEYQENLRFDGGRFHLRIPLVVAPRYSPKPNGHHRSDGPPASVDPVPDRDRLFSPVSRPEWGAQNPVHLSINLEAGFPLGAIESASHEIAVVRHGDTAAAIAPLKGDIDSNRDFTLRFASAPGEFPRVAMLKERIDGEDYLLALVVPPGGDKPRAHRPREAIFVLDSSGSMAGESIRQAKASLLLALDRLTPADRFNVIHFASATSVLYPLPLEATPVRVAEAKAWIADVEADGGTEMLPALLAALDDPRSEYHTRLRQVVFLTDGEVGNESQLFAAIRNDIGRTRLFTVGIGSAPNAYFMSGAARAGRGTYTYVGSAEDVSPRMASLFAKLELPLLTGLSADWPGQQEVEFAPDPLPDLYEGEPVAITMKMPAAAGALVLSGDLGGKPWRIALDLSQAKSAKGIEKLWARNKIVSLEDGRVLGADPDAVDKAVLEIALTHHLVSRLTSLVAVDVTPSRPSDAALHQGHVPLNLPAGWDFDKVFGERTAARQHAANAAPAAALARLAAKSAPAAVVAPMDSGLVLPQGGTAAPLMLIVGLAMLVVGAALVLRTRWIEAGR